MNLPRVPAVYSLFRNGALIYVGQSLKRMESEAKEREMEGK
jgi:hypothetical protein